MITLSVFKHRVNLIFSRKRLNSMSASIVWIYVSSLARERVCARSIRKRQLRNWLLRFPRAKELQSLLQMNSSESRNRNAFLWSASIACESISIDTSTVNNTKSMTSNQWRMWFTFKSVARGVQKLCNDPNAIDSVPFLEWIFMTRYHLINCVIVMLSLVDCLYWNLKTELILHSYALSVTVGEVSVLSAFTAALTRSHHWSRKCRACNSCKLNAKQEIVCVCALHTAWRAWECL